MKSLLFFFSVLVTSAVNAQLLPSIGLSQKPSDNAVLCKPPLYLGSFYASGITNGNSVPDFKLYGLNNDSLQLSSELVAGKPVVLIAGSLTCPVFRNKVNTINQVISTYGNAIKVFVIYTIEAHPTDTSVYFGKVNVTSQNNSAGILFPQPLTYGQRKHLADTMSTWVTLNAPVFIDGPCNEWWNVFGPAPNNAYIISPTGKVLKKQGWFDKSPDRIFCDLDSVLSTVSGSCTINTAPGTFKVRVTNSFISGNPSDLLYTYAYLVNTETVGVSVAVKKLQKSLPTSWETAFCADICYSTAEDSIAFMIPPKDSILFSLDFYTGSTPDSGSVRVGFKNLNKNSNSFITRMRASTISNSVNLSEENFYEDLRFFPNPASNEIYIDTREPDYTISLFDNAGKEVFKGRNSSVIPITGLSRGLYFVSFTSENICIRKKLVVSE